MHDYNQKNIEEFRANGGKLSGGFSGAPVLLLTTTGAKSGRPFTTPLMYLPDGERIIIFASKAGAPTNPDWYHNLVKNPRVVLEVGTEKYTADAAVAAAAERDEFYAKQAQVYPQFAEYQQKTTRQIPVIILERAV